MTARGGKGNPAHKFIMTGNPASVDPSRVERIGCGLLRKPVYTERLQQLVEQVANRLDHDRRLTPIATLTSKALAARDASRK